MTTPCSLGAQLSGKDTRLHMLKFMDKSMLQLQKQTFYFTAFSLQPYCIPFMVPWFQDRSFKDGHSLSYQFS